jgi:hypothetical protein
VLFQLILVILAARQIENDETELSDISVSTVLASNGLVLYLICESVKIVRFIVRYQFLFQNWCVVVVVVIVLDTQVPLLYSTSSPVSRSHFIFCHLSGLSKRSYKAQQLSLVRLVAGSLPDPARHQNTRLALLWIRTSCFLGRPINREHRHGLKDKSQAKPGCPVSSPLVCSLWPGTTGTSPTPPLRSAAFIRASTQSSRCYGDGIHIGFLHCPGPFCTLVRLRRDLQR